ncbi:hypothetical protein QQS21_005127 [Conoideocrella luteorostrata]|uniref:Uncharacterized protein n=1 Tax=Conoideocrella luteorostrata TaxID=1105319 RepID=A0AAJ0CQ12_9HYPO|nr:hypothetical protein QQS21_005127 [Conoideocrella luteorostrata]
MSSQTASTSHKYDFMVPLSVHYNVDFRLPFEDIFYSIRRCREERAILEQMLNSPTSSENHKYDFMAPLSDHCDIDLRLPFEDIYNSIRCREERNLSDSDLIPPSKSLPLSKFSIGVGHKEAGQLWSTRPHTEAASNGMQHIQTSRQTTSLPMTDDQNSYADLIDDYHGVLLQERAVSAALFNPSFRLVGREKLECIKLPPKTPPKVPPKTGHRAQSTMISRSRRDKAVLRQPLLSQPPSFLPAELKSENHWLPGGDVTPRRTITRYDIRGRENDMYGWKTNDSRQCCISLRWSTSCCSLRDSFRQQSKCLQSTVGNLIHSNG